MTDIDLKHYPVSAAGVHSAVIVCPGGGYGGHADHEGHDVALWLNSIGIAAFVLRYRVAPNRHPAPLDDLQAAIRTVRFSAPEFKIDPSKIGILGFSAGGHLVATAATHFDGGDATAEDPIDRVSSRPDAAILCYAVITFGEFGHKGSAINLLGENPDPSLLLSLSNETQVTEQTPPSFLWHTADDDGVPVENSLLFASALSAHKVPFELHVFPKGAHGLGLATDDPIVGQWPKLCEHWLRTIGF